MIQSRREMSMLISILEHTSTFSICIDSFDIDIEGFSDNIKGFIMFENE